MTERLRESEGGAYAPSVQFQREHGPGDRYEFIIYFGCAPKNTDKLIAAALEEIEHIKTDGPAADDLQKFRTEEQRTLETSLQDNRYWLSYLSTKLENGEALNSVLEQSERIKAITAGDIQETARKYLNGQSLIRFVLLPQNN
jgi:zinc protease